MMSNKQYRNIYVLESRNYWLQCEEDYSPDQDLVISFDFGLKSLIESLGGRFSYIDNLCSVDELQKNNFLAAEFFKSWHFDEGGNDIFTSQGVPFGFSLRIEIWSEYLSYVRLRVNLEKLKEIKFQKILVGEKNNSLSDALSETGLDFGRMIKRIVLDRPVYFFDINRYMFDALHGKSIRDRLRSIVVFCLSNICLYIDTFFRRKPNQKIVYVQIYHPTTRIIEALKKDANLRLITSALVPGKKWNMLFSQRLIPLRGRNRQFQKSADLLLSRFKEKRSAKLVLSSGVDITQGAFKVIENQILARVPEALQILNSVMAYIEKHPIHLEVMIANIGLAQTIVDCVLKKKGVPSYLIINGLLGGKFCDEGKYAGFVNCYSESIKKHYFDGAENVLCLGDPRMDGYPACVENIAKIINRSKPRISIGTSGFNNIDLISHVAIEFDFMFDILTALRELKSEGGLFTIAVKVRPNGVLDQYKSFLDEYFSDLEVDLQREVSMSDFLSKTDLYISIYSQTLFEASCMGIPVIYYKKDREFLDPPFDSRSELVTVDSVTELKKAILDFQASDTRFDGFLDRAVMEKYVGPLDGRNLERNLNFIYSLLYEESVGGPH